VTTAEPRQTIRTIRTRIDKLPPPLKSAYPGRGGCLTLVVLGLALVAVGCTTLSNISKMNRYVPVVENLIYLQDNADSEKRMVSIPLCGPTAADAEELARVARVMGWRQAKAYDPASHCLTYVYAPR